MPMEAETMGMLIGGFSFVMALTFIVIITVWYKNRHHKHSYVWIVCHLILFTIGAIYCLQALKYNFTMQSASGLTIHPMASEEISLRLGKAGILWALSMACFLMGVIKLTNKKDLSQG